MPPRRMPERIGDYDIENQLGSGTFGTVYLGVGRPGTAVASQKVGLKVPKELVHRYEDVKREQLEEIAAQLQLERNLFIVPILRVFYYNNLPVIVLPHANGNLEGELGKLKFNGNGSVPIINGREKHHTIEQIKQWGNQIMCGTEWMHANGFIHRDLKPGNILIYNNNTLYSDARIADFGLVENPLEIRGQLGRSVDLVYTPGWRAPEIVCGVETYDFRADNWVVGLILLRMYFNFNVDATFYPEITSINNVQRKIDWPQSWLDKLSIETKNNGKSLARQCRRTSVVAQKQGNDLARALLSVHYNAWFEFYQVVPGLWSIIWRVLSQLLRVDPQERPISMKNIIADSGFSNCPLPLIYQNFNTASRLQTFEEWRQYFPHSQIQDKTLLLAAHIWERLNRTISDTQVPEIPLLCIRPNQLPPVEKKVWRWATLSLASEYTNNNFIDETNKYKREKTLSNWIGSFADATDFYSTVENTKKIILQCIGYNPWATVFPNASRTASPLLFPSPFLYVPSPNRPSEVKPSGVRPLGRRR